MQDAFHGVAFHGVAYTGIGLYPGLAAAQGGCGWRMQEVMAELEECLEEVVWGTQVFTRRWGTNVRDLLAHTPEWCVNHAIISVWYSVNSQSASTCESKSVASLC